MCQLCIGSVPQGTTNLNVSNCPNLRSISNLPEGLFMLSCVQCPQLTSVKNLPCTLTDFNCSHNPQLEPVILPPNLQKLYCSDCVKWGKVDLPQTLQILHCMRNTNMRVKLPASCKVVLSTDCPNLTDTVKEETKLPLVRAKKSKPSGPKGARIAYSFFRSAMTEKLRQEITDGRERLIKIGQLWKTEYSSEESRTEWINLAAADKARFEREIIENNSTIKALQTQIAELQLVYKAETTCVCGAKIPVISFSTHLQSVDHTNWLMRPEMDYEMC